MSDRLSEIKRAHDEGYAYPEDDFDADMGWLIAEVDRLRAEVELLRKEAATTQELGPDWRTKIAREVRRLRAENAAMREVVERD